MSGARPAQDENGDLVWSIFQQGAGLVNAYDATFGSKVYGCADSELIKCRERRAS
jgi:hypothetical protein